MSAGSIDRVIAERERQNEKWGVQTHDDGVWAAILGEEFGEVCQAALHDQFGGDHAGTLREELTHVAAVAVQWLEALDRRESYAS
jgi:NTP pyrophosphatase (non-canonical NTP hydrolase)